MRRAATKKAEATTEWGRRRLLGILAAAVAVAVLLLVGLVYAVYLALAGIGDEANANTGVATGETDHSTVARGAAHRDDIAAEPMLSVPEGAAFPAWKGDLLLPSFTRGLLRFDTKAGMPVGEPEYLLADLKQRMRDIRVGPEGELYLLTDETDGALLKVTPAG